MGPIPYYTPPRSSFLMFPRISLKIPTTNTNNKINTIPKVLTQEYNFIFNMETGPSLHRMRVIWSYFDILFVCLF